MFNKYEMNEFCNDLNITYLARLSANIDFNGSVGDVYFDSNNNDWSDLYYKNGLILNCPLVRFGKNFNTVILPWNSIPNISEVEADIVHARKDCNIKKGISFVWSEVDQRKSIAIGTNYDSDDFYDEIINSNRILNFIKNVERTKFSL